MKSLLKSFFLLFLFITPLTLIAQDSVSVYFRYTPTDAAVRVFVPGEFNNFGPNNGGRISTSSVSLMQENIEDGYWFKTLRLKVGGGNSTNSGQKGYRYKFHEHRNASGSTYEWLQDPLNSKIAAEGINDSWVKITSPMVFQIQPADNEIITIVPPSLRAAVASIDSDPIDVQASKIIVNETDTVAFGTFYDTQLQIIEVPSTNDLGVELINGANKIELLAVTDAGSESSMSTEFSYIKENQETDLERPAGLQDGITYNENSDTEVTFSLFAPGKESAFLIGDFTDWKVDIDFQMNRDSVSPDSIWFWKKVTGLMAGQEYGFQYVIDTNLKIADPYSEKILHPDDRFITSSTYPNLKSYPQGQQFSVGVVQPGATEYNWQVNNFTKPDKENLVVYELLVRDFIANHDYATLIDTLDYLQNLGINAIEFMPINEFEGNESWGYNPSFHLALDKYYGPAEDLKRFVDEAHKRGIAVIVDVVLNHAFGQSPLVRLWNEGDYGKPTSDNPYLNVNAKHPFNVGYDFNHENLATRYFRNRVAKFWIEEYKIDGFRFDLSKGFTQTNNPNDIGAWGNYDQSRVNIWNDYSSYIWSIDSDTYVILEHLSDNSEEVALANLGMMLWGNMNHTYNEASMGYTANSNLYGVLSESRGFQKKHLVGYMESHDEQWLMFKNRSFGNSSGDYDVKELNTALGRQKLVGAFFFTLPGPKMIWQFGEVGYGYGNSGEQCLNDSVDCPASAPGRVSNKPIRWDYWNTKGTERVKLYKTWSALINLRKSSPAFTDPENTTYALTNRIKRIILEHSDTDVVVVGNFDVVPLTTTGDFTQLGTWYDFFSGTEYEVADSEQAIRLEPGEFKIFTTKEFEAPEMDIATSNDDDIDLDSPTSFKLYNNYPNPFNPSTQIEFDVAKTGIVKLEIFDILGRKVATLVNGQKTAGTYSVTFDAASLSSGVYITRFIAGNKVQVQKMTLLK